MNNKHGLSKVVKFRNEANNKMVIGEIESITETREGILYNVVNDDFSQLVKESDIVASFSQDAMRKPRSTVRVRKTKEVISESMKDFAKRSVDN